MKIVTAELTENLRWCIARENPRMYALRSLPGYLLINPLVYPMILGQEGRNSRFRFGCVVENAVLLSTNLLCFKVNLADESSQDPFAPLRDFVPLFLAHLRYCSKQSELSRAIFAGSDCMTYRTEVPAPVFPQIEPDSSDMVSNAELATAISWKHIEQADVAYLAGSPPLYGDVLLDAVQAFLERDDRRVILYSTMSIEIVAKAKLQLARGPRRKQQDDGSTVEMLLDRLPQQVFGRSLRSDLPILFQQAKCLYRTRNGLVHEGRWPTGVDVLSGTNGEGAFRAIECAEAVFQWFGESKQYFPPMGYVEAQVPEGYYVDVRDYPHALPRRFAPLAGLE
ncbi:MAG TPA: hypothetical protein VMV29_22205 [Ktedonobacterales bacterium]|nr:hypothetical protein [Ktedonobacterales bacterium]